MRLMTPDMPSSRSPADSKTKPVVTTSSTPSSPPSTASTPTPAPAGLPSGFISSRRRTLRTYGKKRPLADDAGDANEDSLHLAPQAKMVDAGSDHGESSPKKQKKSGILRYFQPAPLPRGCASASSSSHCTVGETDQAALRGSTSCTTAPEQESAAAVGNAGTCPPSPPSSPPTVRRPRQKRRLLMRLGIPGKESERTKAAGDTQAAAKKEDYGNSGDGGGMTASSVRMRARMRAKILGMCGREGHEQQTPTRKKAPRPVPATQTTLSLTIGGDAMKECRECNILYNPLHEKDAKFHARYHASLRRKRARQGNETVA